ncbi:hypothetical protein FMM05_03130 [Flavobacterium zepuense]|uniref:Uncharacterized protein n=1 Tax=Flavobacterium zepuense TaxID=2593302 RepID=A0A552V7F4_9FLAO|nr:hypothetical protein [Flavobacterium zepuense]TRW26388.1 hypothetical protein FMM05_03130 [Flavobacterium zepuense]
MATDFQLKREQFSSLAFKIRVENLDFFRGKTLAKVYSIGKTEDNKPALIFAKKDTPTNITDKLTAAFNSVFV